MSLLTQEKLLSSCCCTAPAERWSAVLGSSRWRGPVGQGARVLGDALVDLVDGHAGGFGFHRSGSGSHGGSGAHQQVGGQGAQGVFGSGRQVVLDDVLGHLLEQHGLGRQRDLADPVEVPRRRLRHQPGCLADHHVGRHRDLRRGVGKVLRIGELHRLHDLAIERCRAVG